VQHRRQYVLGDDARAEFAERARATFLQAAVDGVAVAIAASLRDAGVRAILLKGASFARWLYADGTPRFYVDVDLLVRADLVGGAESLLRERGYSPLWSPTDMPADRPIASHWRRADGGAPIDLHWALPEAAAAPPMQWEALVPGTERIELAGGEVETLGPRGRCVMVALHAARHADLPRPAEDLERALQVADRFTWTEAAELADRIGARDGFSAGLHTLPAGVELAESIGVGPPQSTRAVLLLQSPPPGADGLDALFTARGARARVRLVARTLVPTRRWMIASTARARRGGLWLAASYLWHPLGVMARLPAAVRAWRRARGQRSSAS
jgi:hypothetical protein